MSQSVRPASRKITTIRTAARGLELCGDNYLAELLNQIATAYDDFAEDDPANIGEALRWTPVLYSATRLARSVLP